MEREEIKSIFGDNFIGKDELQPFFRKLNIDILDFVEPLVEYSDDELYHASKRGYILILGISKIGNNYLSIKFLKEHFGNDPNIFEPCFYNQDWYLDEHFVNVPLEDKWYLIKKDVYDSYRAIEPGVIVDKISFPSAILCAYTFFAYFCNYHKYLWYHDFVWCSDLDHNGDRIYVGKYNDIDGLNKNGFSIHRHLSLRQCYSAVDIL